MCHAAISRILLAWPVTIEDWHASLEFKLILIANTTTTAGHDRALHPKMCSLIDAMGHHFYFKETGLDTYFIFVYF